RSNSSTVMVRGSGFTPPRRISPWPPCCVFGDALMLQLTLQSRIFVSTEPVDYRNGIDGLDAVCCCALDDNPLSGALYPFRNRASTTLKILCYDFLYISGAFRRLYPVGTNAKSMSCGTGTGRRAGHRSNRGR